MRAVGALLCLAVCGCATPAAQVTSQEARGVVERHLGGGATIAGPFGPEGKKELDVLKDEDRRSALSFLDQGALGFLVYMPDYATVVHSDKGSVDMIKVDQIILVLDGRVVGSFHAE